MSVPGAALLVAVAVSACGTGATAQAPGGAAGVSPILEPSATAQAATEQAATTFALTARGESIRSSVTPPPGLDPALVKQLEGTSSQISDLTVPFPAEPVGVGARWTARTEAELNGISTMTDYTYTLSDRSDTGYVIDATYVQGGPRQRGVQLDGLPAGVTADVDTIDITGKATSSGTVTQLLPVSSSVQGGGTMGLTVNNGAQASAIEQALQLAIELRQAS